MSSDANTKVSLDLRGVRLTLERESLMELPESVLLCLFPNGVVLSPQRQQRLEGQEDEPEDVYYVDFDAQCLEFVLDFFSQARDGFYGPPEGPRRDLAESIPSNQANLQNPLFLKQAIIVLREELEYFAIPPPATTSTATTTTDSLTSSTNSLPAKETDQDLTGLEKSFPATDSAGKPNSALLQLKMDCGDALLDRRSIFTALQRNVNRENNVAEQHLIDMLCMSGFEREDVWGYRSLEPNRCCIASIALVLLKTGIVHPPITAADNAAEPKPQVEVNAQQLATAQKLLLFWRKPARKCWWDATEVILHEGTPKAQEVKVWARRVWTLELSLI